MRQPSFTHRYRALAQLLQPLASCWNQSVLHHWPACRDALPEDWWQPYVGYTMDQLYGLDEWVASYGATEAPDGCTGGLRAFIEAVAPWLDFALSPLRENLAEQHILRMTAKKQHEIAAMLPALRAQKQRLGFERGIDIGGGMGHLARLLMQELDLPMISIDRNTELQTMGRSLADRHQIGPDRLQFVTSEVVAAPQSIDALMVGDCLSLGLHTCGPLAWTHLQKSRRSACALNFGCCYDRMDATVDCHRSAVAQANPLPLTSFALFLATRGRRRTRAELQMQERVNTYRLALHLFLIEEGLATGFIGVGDAPKPLYGQNFAAYAQNRLEHLGMSADVLAGRAEQFWQRDTTQQAMREFFVMNIVRNAFARPLEVLLLLDRALWLEEQGQRVTIEQYFDPTVSPRNLGIMTFAQEKG